MGGQTESTATENSTKSHLLVGTICMASVDDKMSVFNLYNADVLSPSKSNLEPFCSLESIGITDSPRTCDDDQATTGTLSLGHGRSHIPHLPRNYQMAVGRLKSILSRLQKDPQLLKSYADIMQEQLERGIIEVVTSEFSQALRTTSCCSHTKCDE